ncbi:MAG: hypothetical protein BGP24_19400 [Lysobacterales bacterium 69-70]|nr:hypothetical protein [Xanthomonadaceae bacterium]ODU34070.1 MAG: hypothetical protein ABS97_10560 [Xanthomonadaceae bacterium SCN 69-320]ODV18764.1 MAG: hypothetical protein ABT27_13270 [Xanthomonadaceae bacterium SCN 69-25]OJY93031.1 MAG: hypothetical protein BGP24_19400 [Xanthomonadales bacterium 69-70]
MKTHWEFFKESDHSFGMFYPRHYILAGFDSYAQARRAEEELRRQGFTDGEVRSATGEFVVNELESADGANFVDRAKAWVARFVGTEAGYIDDDLELARNGGAFLFIYAPTDPDCRRAMAALEPQRPVFARRYLSMAIERLIYPARVQPDV